MSDKQQILSLTGVRGWAALWVILFHIIIKADIFTSLDWGFIEPFARKGYLGVDLFFILSGLIISYSYAAAITLQDPQGIYHFIKLRFARIYPVHLFILFVFLIYVVAYNVFLNEYPPDLINNKPSHYSYYAIDFFLNVLNIQAWDVTDHLSWNFPAWSMSAEWFAYLAYPFFAGILFRYNSVRLNIGAIAILLVLYHVFLKLSIFESLGQLSIHLGLVRVLAEFLFGCLLYNIYRQAKSNGMIFTWMPWVALVVLGLSLYYNFPDVAVVGFLGFVIYSLAQNDSGILGKVLFSNRVSVYFGKISYAMYMVHALPIIWYTSLRTHMFSNQNYTLVREYSELGALLAATVLLSILIYHFVESPMRAYLRKTNAGETLFLRGWEKATILLLKIKGRLFRA